MNDQISDSRIAHMHGVAEYMYHHARDYALDPDAMYILGLLHDIGYLYGAAGHEKTGADLLIRNGFPYAESVLVHGKRLNSSCSAETILLVEADMHVDLTGEDVGYDVRLRGIAGRHGKDSQAYRTCAANIAWLREHGRM